MFKRIFALFCCLSMLFSCFSASASALVGLPDFSVSQDDWNSNWNETGNVNTNVCLTPGSNETELNFAWHAELNAVNPTVNMSSSSAMNNPAVFTGDTLPADEGYVTCRVTATGLQPNTVYYYTYGTGSLVYGPYVYRTLNTDNFKFLYFNDMHQGFDSNNVAYGRDTSYKIHKVLNTALTENPDISFMLSGGDQIRSGYIPGEWNALLASPVFRSIPVAFAIGNHDNSGDMMKNYINNPNAFNAALPSAAGTDYWFRYGDALFLVFDSNNGYVAEHIRFAKDAVNKNLDAKWRIGMLHHDIYTPAYPIKLPAHFEFTPIADMAGLDVMLRGHSHIYGRSHFMDGGKIVDRTLSKSITNPKGTTYISMNAFQNEQVSTFPFENTWTAKRLYGTAAVYSTFEISEDKLVLKAFSPTGRLRDDFTIIKTETGSEPFDEPAGFTFYSIVKLIGFIYAVFDYAID